MSENTNTAISEEKLDELSAEYAELMDAFMNARRQCSVDVKEATERGEVVIGSFCQFAPMEMILAAGCHNVMLCGFNYDPAIPVAEAHLPANLCPLIKSSYGNIYGDYCPFAHFADMIVGETTCDGKKKMYEMLGEFRKTHVIHLPNVPDRERSLEAWKSELKRFQDRLESEYGVEITPEKLNDKIRVMNNERKQMASVYELGRLDPPAMTGVQMRNIMTGVYFMLDKDKRARELGRLVELSGILWENGRGPWKRSDHRPRILVSGAGIDGVVDKTVGAIERAGGSVVCFEGCCGIGNMRRLTDEDTDDPLQALAEKLLDVPCAVMSPNDNRFKQLRDTIDEWRIDGVISVTVHACDTFEIESKKLNDICDSEHVPFLHLITDYAPGDEAQLDTRIQAFIETLG